MKAVQPAAAARPERPAIGLAGRLARSQVFAPLALLAVAVALPLVVSSQFRLRVLVIVFINATLAIGLSISLGYAGQFNLSQGTFYGIGAYTTALIVTDLRWPFEIAILLAAVAAGVAGLLFGVASLRVRGDYFALLSLAFTIAMVQAFENGGRLTHGREGFAGIPVVELFGLRLLGVHSFYYSTLGLLVVTWLIVARLARTYLGRAMLAVGYDEIGARAMGVSVAHTKLLALAVSSMIAGMAGAFLVATIGFIAPSNFDLLPSISATIFVIIGGMTKPLGIFAAVAIVTLATEQFRGIADYSLALLGIVVLVAVFYRGGVIRDVIGRGGSQ